MFFSSLGDGDHLHSRPNPEVAPEITPQVSIPQTQWPTETIKIIPTEHCFKDGLGIAFVHAYYNPNVFCGSGYQDYYGLGYNDDIGFGYGYVNGDGYGDGENFTY